MTVCRISFTYRIDNVENTHGHSLCIEKYLLICWYYCITSHIDPYGYNDVNNTREKNVCDYTDTHYTHASALTHATLTIRYTSKLIYVVG